jgi:ABC-type transport system involved in cytochrome bd biosynthesis fused ATPase/permease subunit
MNSLDGLGRGVTLLIVSHRLSALQGCDAVVTLVAGAVDSHKHTERSSEHRA